MGREKSGFSRTQACLDTHHFLFLQNGSSGLGNARVSFLGGMEGTPPPCWLPQGRMQGYVRRALQVAGRGRVFQWVFAQVASVFLTQNTLFNRYYSVALSVRQVPGVRPDRTQKWLPPSPGDCILGEQGGT